MRHFLWLFSIFSWFFGCAFDESYQNIAAKKGGRGDILFVDSSLPFDREFYSYAVPENTSRLISFYLVFSKGCLGEATYDPSITSFDLFHIHFFSNASQAIPLAEFIVRYSFQDHPGVTDIIYVIEMDGEVDRKTILFTSEQLGGFKGRIPTAKHADLLTHKFMVIAWPDSLALTKREGQQPIVRLPYPINTTRFAVRRGIRHCQAYIGKHNDILRSTWKREIPENFRAVTSDWVNVDDEYMEQDYRSFHFCTLLTIVLMSPMILLTTWALFDGYLEWNVLRVVREEWRSIRDQNQSSPSPRRRSNEKIGTE